MDISQPSASTPTVKKSVRWLKYVGLAIIIIGVVVGPLGRYIRVLENSITSSQEDRALNKYSAEIQACVDAKGSETGQVFGQDYECALDVAATLYAQDPETAIKLCMKYQSGGLKQNNPSLASELCRSQIEERLKKK